MIHLPENKRDNGDTEDLCKCRPICKSRRRQWKGHIQNTSEELMLERKGLTECFRRWPKQVYPNGPCPLLGRTRRITIKNRNVIPPARVVRICQAPIDDTVETPYLKYAQLAKEIEVFGHLVCYDISDGDCTCCLGAWGAVHARCAFCTCGSCCPCAARGYVLHDAERATRVRAEMRNFDAHVKTDCLKMRIMYDKI